MRQITDSCTTDKPADHRGIISATLLLVALNGASRATGFLREAMMAFFLGANAHTDSYVFAYMFYDWATVLGIAVVITALSSFSRRNGENNYWTFAIAIFAMMVPIVLGMNAVMSRLVAPLQGGSSQAEIVRFSHLINWTFLLVTYSSLQCALFQNRRKFLLPGLMGTIVNLVSIATLVLFHSRWGVFSMACGLVAGFVVQIGIQEIAIWALKIRRTAVAGMANWMRNGVQFAKQMWAIAASQLLIKLQLVIDRLLVFALGPGFLSYLSYASRIAQLPLSLIGFATSTALLPSQVQARNRSRQEFAILTERAFRAMFIFGTLATSLVYALALPLVEFTYHRGYFVSSDVYFTTRALVAYSGMVLPTFTSAILTNALYCSTRPRVYLGISALSIGGYAVVAYLMVHWLGFTGIGWAATVMGNLTTIGIYLLLLHLGELTGGTGILLFCCKSLLSGVCCWGAAWYLYSLLHVSGSHAPLLVRAVTDLVLPSVLGCAFFYCIGKIFLKVDEIRLIEREIKRLIARNLSRAVAAYSGDF